MDGQSELNKKLRRRMPEFILIKENGIVAFPRNLSLRTTIHTATVLRI